MEILRDEEEGEEEEEEEAGAGGSCPAPAARPAGAGAGEEEPAGEDDWLNEAVEELLRHAAACAAAELP